MKKIKDTTKEESIKGLNSIIEKLNEKRDSNSKVFVKTKKIINKYTNKQ